MNKLFALIFALVLWHNALWCMQQEPSLATINRALMRHGQTYEGRGQILNLIETKDINGPSEKITMIRSLLVEAKKNKDDQEQLSPSLESELRNLSSSLKNLKRESK